MDTLETARLIIRPFLMGDLEDTHRLLDKDIQWAGPSFPLDRREEKLQLYIALADWDDTGRIYGSRAVVLKESAQLIGICGFHPDLWSPRWKAAFWPQLFPDCDLRTAGRYASLELGTGYALSGHHRGHGYAAEAVNAFLDHAFVSLKVARVFAMTERDNVESVRLMECVGMRVAWNPDTRVVWPGAVGVAQNPLISPLN